MFGSQTSDTSIGVKDLKVISSVQRINTPTLLVLNKQKSYFGPRIHLKNSMKRIQTDPNVDTSSQGISNQTPGPQSCEGSVFVLVHCLQGLQSGSEGPSRRKVCSNSRSWPMKLRLGDMMERLDLTSR